MDKVENKTDTAEELGFAHRLVARWLASPAGDLSGERLIEDVKEELVAARRRGAASASRATDELHEQLAEMLLSKKV